MCCRVLSSSQDLDTDRDFGHKQGPPVQYHGPSYRVGPRPQGGCDKDSRKYLHLSPEVKGWWNKRTDWPWSSQSRDGANLFRDRWGGVETRERGPGSGWGCSLKIYTSSRGGPHREGLLVGRCQGPGCDRRGRRRGEGDWRGSSVRWRGSRSRTTRNSQEDSRATRL